MSLLLLCFTNSLFLSYSLDCNHFDSNMGATFDLTDLIRAQDQPSYFVEDGDIPCTTYVEKNYTYIFNICGNVALGVPRACQTMNGLASAGALQIDKRVEDDPNDDYCYVVGAYSASTKLSLLGRHIFSNLLLIYIFS